MTYFNFRLLVVIIESRCQVLRADEIANINIDMITYKKLDPHMSMIGPLQALELAYDVDVLIAERVSGDHTCKIQKEPKTSLE